MCRLVCKLVIVPDPARGVDLAQVPNPRSLSRRAGSVSATRRAAVAIAVSRTPRHGPLRLVLQLSRGDLDSRPAEELDGLRGFAVAGERVHGRRRAAVAAAALRP